MKYTVEENIHDLKIDDRLGYSIILSSIDFSNGNIKIVITNKLTKYKTVCISETTIEHNTVMAKLNHNANSVIKEILCFPKENNIVNVPLKELVYKHNIAFIFTLSIKFENKVYYKYDFIFYIDFDFNTIEVNIKKYLGADYSIEESINNIDFKNELDKDLWLDLVNQLSNDPKDKASFIKALELSNLDDEGYLYLLGLYYKKYEDYKNYIYNMRQLVARNNILGLIELAELFLNPTKNTEEKEEGFKYACKLEELNNPLGNFWKGYAIFYGIGTERSIEIGREHLRKYILHHDDNKSKIAFARHILYNDDSNLIGNIYSSNNTINQNNIRHKDVQEKPFKFKCVLSLICAVILIFTIRKFCFDYLMNTHVSGIQENISEESETEEEFEFTATPSFDTSDFNMINVKSISAESELISREGKVFYADYMIDGDIMTSWQEGDGDYGKACAIDIEFDNNVDIDVIEFYLGKQTSQEQFLKNNRPSKLLILHDSKPLVADFEDILGSQSIVLNKPINTNHLRIYIDGVYRGTDYNDTNISEILFWHK